jgi:hypothetical protein
MSRRRATREYYYFLANLVRKTENEAMILR